MLTLSLTKGWLWVLLFSFWESPHWCSELCSLPGCPFFSLSPGEGIMQQLPSMSLSHITKHEQPERLQRTGEMFSGKKNTHPTQGHLATHLRLFNLYPVFLPKAVQDGNDKVIWRARTHLNSKEIPMCSTNEAEKWKPLVQRKKTFKKLEDKF